MASTNFKSIGAAAALALALSVGGVTAAGAETYTPSGEVSVSNPSPKAGSSVTFSGKTTPNTVVTVTISLATSSNGLSSAAATTYTLGSTTSDAEGFYSLSATIPADLPTGNYVVAASAGGTVISSSADLPWDYTDRDPILLEEKVPFDTEVSQLVARRPSGEIRAWPLVTSVQRDGICFEVTAPAPVRPDATSPEIYQIKARSGC